MTFEQKDIFLASCLEGNIKKIMEFCDYGYDINFYCEKYGATPLMIALEHATPDEEPSNAQEAQRVDHLIDIAILLINRGSLINLPADRNHGYRGARRPQLFPLGRAIDRSGLPRLIEIIQLLLLDKITVNLAAPDTGETALMTAARLRKSEIIELLIAHGANINEIANDDGADITACSLAIFSDFCKRDELTISILAAAGADLAILKKIIEKILSECDIKSIKEAPDEEIARKTPNGIQIIHINLKQIAHDISLAHYIQSLFNAVEIGDVKKFKILLHLKPNLPLGLRNRNGETLWHIAIRKKDKVMLTHLVWFANEYADKPDFKGKTFTEYALIYNEGVPDLLEFCCKLTQ